jgi:hypothetical protein
MREEIFQKINADNKSKQHVVLHWGSFALVSLAIFLCTIALPNTFTENGIDPCKEKLNLPHFNLTCHEAELSLTNERTLIVSDYNPLNMFIYIQGSITMNSKAKIDEVF